MSLCWVLSLDVQIPGRQHLDGSTGLNAYLLTRMGRVFDEMFYQDWIQCKL